MIPDPKPAAARKSFRRTRLLQHWAGGLSDWVPIRSLGRRHCRRIAEHLKSLGEHDRYLRFGYPATDEQIERYAMGLDFRRDEVLGIFNRRLQLVAVAHLAYAPAPQRTDKPAMAEFGVSVLKSGRGRGFGRRLYERATLHGRNRGISTLFIHALTENAPMLKIARNAGAAVERDGSESEAWLRLPPDTVATHVGEALERHLAEVDFEFKRRWKALSQFVDSLAAVRAGLYRR